MCAAMSCFDSYVYSHELNSYFIAGVTYSVLMGPRFAVQDESGHNFPGFFPRKDHNEPKFLGTLFPYFFLYCQLVAKITLALSHETVLS